MDLTNQIDQLPLGIIVDIEKEDLIYYATNVPEIFMIKYGPNALLEFILTQLIYGDNDDYQEYEISFT
ncbi:MAG: hypothetical protein R3321_11585 [Nitrososphaeraceae archaeon]|nr:hypothetical protein [Nitrososphaeraceae archaeon]